MEVFHAMGGHGMVPNMITYTALINACERSKQPQWAVEMLHVMQHQDVVPNIITYSAVISEIKKSQQRK